MGAGGHGKEILAYVEDLKKGGSKIDVKGFIDEVKLPVPFESTKILGDLKYLERAVRRSKISFHYLTAIGDNQGRKEFVERLEKSNFKNLRAWTLIHPLAHVGRKVKIGEGSCLAPGSITTTHVVLGKHCIVNVGVSISHDCVIGDFSNINPSATLCGNVKIGEGCFVGTGAKVVQKISIGDWSVIGAGAVVTADIPAHVTAIGIPARIVKKLAKGGF